MLPPVPRMVWHLRHCVSPLRLAARSCLAAAGVARARGQDGDARQLLRVDLARRREGEHRLVAQVGIGAVAQHDGGALLQASSGSCFFSLSSSSHCAAAARPGQRRHRRLAQTAVVILLPRTMPCSSSAAGWPALFLPRASSCWPSACTMATSSGPALSPGSYRRQRMDRLGRRQGAQRLDRRRLTGSGGVLGRVTRPRPSAPGRCAPPAADQGQAGRRRLRLRQQRVDGAGQLLALAQAAPLVREKQLEVVDDLVAHLGRHVGLQHLEHAPCPAALSSDSGEDVDDAAALTTADSFGVGQLLAERRHHRRRPQFPDEVGDLVVPLGELLVEVLRG